MTPPPNACIGLRQPISLLPTHPSALPEHAAALGTHSSSPLHSLSASRPTLLNPILTPCCPGAWRRLIQLLSGWIAAQRRRPGRPSSTRSFEASTCRTPRHARSGPRPPTAPARSHQVAFLWPSFVGAAGNECSGNECTTALLAARARATPLPQLVGRTSACQMCPDRMFICRSPCTVAICGRAQQLGMMKKKSCVASVTMTLVWGVICEYMKFPSRSELPFGRGAANG